MFHLQYSNTISQGFLGHPRKLDLNIRLNEVDHSIMKAAFVHFWTRCCSKCSSSRETTPPKAPGGEGWEMSGSLDRGRLSLPMPRRGGGFVIAETGLVEGGV